MYQGEKSKRGGEGTEKARKEEGGAEGAEAREAETTVSLFMGFTGVRSTARAAEGTAPLRTRAWQVLLPSVNRGRRYCLLSRRQPIRPTSRAYVRVYCWPAVAFPIISSPENNGRLNSGRFSREVNVHLFKVIRTSTNPKLMNATRIHSPRPLIELRVNGVDIFIISYLFFILFFQIIFIFNLWILH